jgi:hypothetical protein
VEAPAQGDEGETLEEVENPGEHRAPDGINPRLGATNSRGEKGPEDEPISQRTACLRFRTRSGPRFVAREERRTPGLKTCRQLRLVARVKDARRLQSLALQRHHYLPQTVSSGGRVWHEPRPDAPGKDRLRPAPSGGGGHRLCWWPARVRPGSFGWCGVLTR